MDSGVRRNDGSHLRFKSAFTIAAHVKHFRHSGQAKRDPESRLLWSEGWRFKNRKGFAPEPFDRFQPFALAQQVRASRARESFLDPYAII
ncbi:MAG: hypothetical protein ACREV0_00945, partial [Burkholderiales bacterium]